MQMEIGDFFSDGRLSDEERQLIFPFIARLKGLLQTARGEVFHFVDGVDALALPLIYLYKLPYRSAVVDAVAEIKAIGCDAVVVVGIGGSSLGARAIVQAVGTVLPIYFLETIDVVDYAGIDTCIRTHRAVQVVIVSKSGTTLETVVNGALVVDLLREKYGERWTRHATVISEEHSKLSVQARDEGIRVVEMPTAVGGRFSVFSAAGLLPLLLAGVDVDRLCEGALAALESVGRDDLMVSAFTQVVYLYRAYQAGYIIHDLFAWEHSLMGLGAWQRQLIAESLGKRENVLGKVVEQGIFPTVSLGTQDLHSMLQLYLGGPRRVVTTFLITKQGNNVMLPQNGWCPSLYQGKSIAAVREAIIDGVVAAYRADARPYIAVRVEKDVYDIGYWMSMQMVAIMALGILFEVNVFDQPEVEAYKRNARALLEKMSS